MPSQHYWNGKPVPCITAWSAEGTRRSKAIRIVGRGGKGIGYADEDPVADRRCEALWERCSLAPSRGRPEFQQVNPLRRRRAVRHRLCRVCGKSICGRRADERTLRLVGSNTPITEGETTVEPPAHLACAVESIENCSPLRRGFAAALVECSPLRGVAAVVYDRKTLTSLSAPAKPSDLSLVGVDEERIRTPAGCAVHSLHGVFPVTRQQLYEPAEDDARHRAAA
jgi:hypothetical protein